jgi:hypothetical protein
MVGVVQSPQACGSTVLERVVRGVITECPVKAAREVIAEHRARVARDPKVVMVDGAEVFPLAKVERALMATTTTAGMEANPLLIFLTMTGLPVGVALKMIMRSSNL